MRLTRKQFAEYAGYSEHEISQRIADGMPVHRRFGLLGRVEIDPHEAVPWLLRRAGVKDEFEDDETEHYRVDELIAEADRVLAEVFKGITPEEAQRLADKNSDELYFLLRRYWRDRAAEASEKLRERFQLKDGTDGDQSDE